MRPNQRGRATLFTRILLAGSLVPALAGIHALSVAGHGYWPHASVLTWYAVLVWVALELAIRRGWPLRPFLALVVVHLLVLTPEVALRLAGFRHEAGIQFGYPRPSEFVRFAPDAELFWILRPDDSGVNPQGFRTLPLPRPDEPDLTRVVVLGDSVALQGYPDTVETLLNAQGAGRFEVLNMSMAGYTTHQGRALVERHGEAMAADVAVVSYGWNDHWLAWGAVDADKVVRVDKASTTRLLAALYRRSRLAQAWRYLLGSRGSLSTRCGSRRPTTART